MAETGVESALTALGQQLAAERQQLADLTQLWAAADEELRRAIRTTQEAVRKRIGQLKREMQQRQGPAVPDVDLGELLPHLALLAEDWALLWPATQGEVKRQIVRACVAEVEAIALPVPGRHRWRREVGEVRLRDWLTDRRHS